MSEAIERYGEPRVRREWSQDRLRALRRHLGLTQQAFADELGIRQQTVSEWETGVYRPRGASTRLLGMVAERAGFAYGEPPPAHTSAGRRDEEAPPS